MWLYLLWMVVMVWLVWFSPWKKPARVRRAEMRGVRGEADVAAALQTRLAEMCGSHFVLRHAVILNIAPGTPYPTAEIDHLAITPFGIFVVETKAWRGQILPGQDNDTLTWISPAGETEVRKSPLAQNRAKVAFIRGLFPDEFCVVAGVGVFSSPEARVSPDLSVDLIGMADLRHWLRGRLNSWRDRTMNHAMSESVDVASTDREIMKFVDVSPDAGMRHKERVIGNAEESIIVDHKQNTRTQSHIFTNAKRFWDRQHWLVQRLLALLLCFTLEPVVIASYLLEFKNLALCLALFAGTLGG